MRLTEKGWHGCGGNFDAPLTVLDSDIVLRVYLRTVPAGASREVRGAEAAAGQALGYSRIDPLVRPALVNGAAGHVAILDGRCISLGGSTVTGGGSSNWTSSPTRPALPSST